MSASVGGDAAVTAGVRRLAQPAIAVLPSRRFTAATVTDLRHRLTTALTVHAIPAEAIERFVLAVHEMAANAVRHGGGSGTIQANVTATHGLRGQRSGRSSRQP